MIIFAALSMAMTLDLSSNNEVFNKRSCKIDGPISSLGSYCGPLVDALLALLTVVIYHTFSKHQDPKHSSILTLFRHIRFGYSRKSILLYRCFRRFLVWIGVINLLLLTYSNMSINNPGPPQNLSVLYQNVQGLIPVSELINRNPSLNETKLAELQAHVYTNKPDIIILNETWLKESINDNEIFPPEAYKIFRCDRSTNSHPLDPNNPNRFRKNGGGVLIAINSSLDVTSQKINTSCKAEVLSIELTLKNKTKMCISTVYKVGTLGSQNLSALTEYYNNLRKTKKSSRMYIVGDLNLQEISAHDWQQGHCQNPLGQSFLELFDKLGFVQCIKEPTHKQGNLLDILLTNIPQTLTDASVEDEDSVCMSDHFPITFQIKANVRRKKALKEKSITSKKLTGIN